MMSYKIVKDKIVISKDGVYFSLTPQQLDELQELLQQIKQDTSSVTTLNDIAN